MNAIPIVMLLYTWDYTVLIPCTFSFSMLLLNEYKPGITKYYNCYFNILLAFLYITDHYELEKDEY